MTVLTTPSDDLVAIANKWLSGYASALYSGDAKAVAETFQPGGWFRDVLTFSWDLRTLEGRDKIAAFLAGKLPSVQISNVKLSDNQHLRPSSFAAGSVEGVEFGYTYETPIARGQGLARLLPDAGGAWKGHIVTMIVMDLKGHEELSGRYVFEDFVGGKAWPQYTAEQRRKFESDPHVLIGAWLLTIGFLILTSLLCCSGSRADRGASRCPIQTDEYPAYRDREKPTRRR